MTATTKVAIITGASQGIGAGRVTGFRGAGYAVVGHSRSIGSVDELWKLLDQELALDLHQAKNSSAPASRARSPSPRAASAGTARAASSITFCPEAASMGCPGRTPTSLAH
jgi:NAD(P)-dependent dehydrogenase (short-subunit alcohol dehydrogenase family)